MFSLALGIFAGPLDVLLGLVERAELDVATVPLAEVVRQYLLYRAEQQPHADETAEFIAFAARLMVHKSRALLPRPTPPPPPDEPPVDLELIMAEYRRFKAAADALRERVENGWRSYPRLAPPPAIPPTNGLSQVTLQRLAAIVRAVLAQQVEPAVGEVAPEPVTIREKVEELEALLARDGRVSFTAFIGAARSRVEVVVAFLAVLELVRRGQVVADQPAPFGDIVIEAVASRTLVTVQRRLPPAERVE